MRAADSNPNRVVYDTNILISAYLWKGLPRKALELARTSRCQLVISNETLYECIRVLASPKFGLAPEEIVPMVNDLTSFAIFVPLRSHITVIEADPSDNIFLGLAVDARAGYIVSGDKHLLRLRSYRKIQILSVSRFVQQLVQ